MCVRALFAKLSRSKLRPVLNSRKASVSIICSTSVRYAHNPESAQLRIHPRTHFALDHFAKLPHPGRHCFEKTALCLEDRPYEAAAGVRVHCWYATRGGGFKSTDPWDSLWPRSQRTKEQTAFTARFANPQNTGLPIYACFAAGRSRRDLRFHTSQSSSVALSISFAALCSQRPFCLPRCLFNAGTVRRAPK